MGEWLAHAARLRYTRLRLRTLGIGIRKVAGLSTQLPAAPCGRMTMDECFVSEGSHGVCLRSRIVPSLWNRQVNRMSFTRWSFVIGQMLVVLVCTSPVTAQRSNAAPRPIHDSTWRDHRIAARVAFNAGNFVGYRDQLLELDDLMSGSPQVVYSLAIAEARLNNTDRAIGYLHRFASMRLIADVASDSAFAMMRGTQAFNDVIQRIKQNEVPTSHSKVAFVLPEADLLSEDITYDRTTQVFYVSSVRKRKIVAIDRDHRVTDFTSGGATEDWGILAVAVDPLRRVLWATTAAMPMTLGYQARDSGRSALLEYDLGTRSLLHRYDLPTNDGPHALGDMTLSAQGDVYVSDGAAGIVYALRRGERQLVQLVPKGTLPSPQTPALSRDGVRLYIPDYARGIAILDLRDRSITWLAHSKDLAVNGIDGMYLNGRTLLAIQNGTSPERVIRMHLNSVGKGVDRWDILEANSHGLGDPTHGVMVGSSFYFIANSGWDRFADDGTVKPGGFTNPVVRRAADAIR